MANIQPRASTVLSSLGAALSFSNETHPPIPQLNTLLERNWDQGAHVLHRERGCRDPALALVHLALRGEHADAYQAGDEGARLPGLLVYGRVLHDVSKGDGVESEETLVPLYADADASRGVDGERNARHYSRGGTLVSAGCAHSVLQTLRAPWGI